MDILKKNQNIDQKFRYKFFFSLFICILILGGSLNIFITPPFENFDEAAHFSAIKQIAYENKIVKKKDSFVDKNIQNYKQIGPGPYGSGIPPFDKGEHGIVYYKFFNSLEKKEDFIKTLNSPPLKSYEKGEDKNHQYTQHPFLFYLILSLPFKFLENFNLLDQILILRFICYLISLIGIGLGIKAILNLCKNKNDLLLKKSNIILGLTFYPLIFPGFFIEFARIGNDSLCVMLIGLFLYIYSNLENKTKISNDLFYLGIILALGLLTKAFFIPFSFASFFFLIFIFFKKNFSVKKIFINIIIFLSPIIVVIFYYYIDSFLSANNLIGVNIINQMSEKNVRIFDVFLIDNFLKIFIRGILTIPVTFIWSGTASLVHINYFLYLIPILIILFIIYMVFVNLKEFRSSHFFYFSIFVLSIFFIGLIIHSLLHFITWKDNANSPGWYLHMLFPFIVPFVGYGIKFINYKILITILVLSFLSLFWIYWSQFSLFSGCAIKNVDKSYKFNSDYFCFDNFSILLENLNLISFPMLFIYCFVFFLIAYFVIIKILIESLNNLKED